MSSSGQASSVRASPKYAARNASRSSGAELVVDREVREVEEPVSHARVLPVDDAEALAVVEEVRVQEVVVARPWGLAPAKRLDPQRDRVRLPVLVGDLPAARERRLAVRLDDAEGVERAGNRRAVVERAKRRGDAAQELRRAHRLEQRDLAFDEARDEPALGLDEGDHLGADAELGRPLRRRELDRAVDAEQARVLAGDAEDVDLAVDLDLEVVVRDPAAERLDARRPVGPDALDRSFESAHARILSPFGSKSGSAAISPPTHSPKISTSTSVPTSCSAGTYAYAIERSTV